MHILLVEDHGESRDVLAKLLGHCGHTVAVAGDIFGASRQLEVMPFDVLLCDLGLPDGEAFDLARRTKQLQRAKRMVALTGRESAEDRQRAESSGFDHYLTKPFDFHELRALLGQMEPLLLNP